MTYQTRIYNARRTPHGAQIANPYRYAVVASGDMQAVDAAFQAASAANVDALYGAAVVRIVAVNQGATYQVAERVIAI